MEITIDVMDYIDENDLKREAIMAIRSAFSAKVRSEFDLERVLTNLSYQYVFKIVAEVFNLSLEDFEKKLSDKISQILDNNDNLRFAVFHDGSCGPESPAHKYLHEVLLDCKPKIEKKVDEVINQYPFNEVKNEICGLIYDVIDNKFFPNKQED